MEPPTQPGSRHQRLHSQVGFEAPLTGRLTNVTAYLEPRCASGQARKMSRVGLLGLTDEVGSVGSIGRSRLRRQDVGLKTHLDQLDQQISELQLDVRRSSSEAPDSDSRPSSGFYELSDGGSCSLSTSCTSVCSDRLSSSLGTLLPATAKAGPSAGDCRPRSADETTVCGVPLPTWGFQASEEGESRPRPVSTGDLERALPAEVRLQKASAHPKATSLLCHGVDPKFQRDLVSKGGREVYPYPSPLHAVALQSPLFALTKETLQNDSPLPPGQPPPGPAGPSSIRASLGPDAGPAGAYIDKLLRLRGRGPAPRGSGPICGSTTYLCAYLLRLERGDQRHSPETSREVGQPKLLSSEVNISSHPIPGTCAVRRELRPSKQRRKGGSQCLETTRSSLGILCPGSPRGIRAGRWHCSPRCAFRSQRRALVEIKGQLRRALLPESSPLDSGAEGSTAAPGPFPSNSATPLRRDVLRGAGKRCLSAQELRRGETAAGSTLSKTELPARIRLWKGGCSPAVHHPQLERTLEDEGSTRMCWES
ncbi:hypothetical protein CB1_000377003 [Camelus ferus]|nr:hypothetical protein CB1_000377003 [Camelus ferus]